MSPSESTRRQNFTPCIQQSNIDCSGWVSIEEREKRGRGLTSKLTGDDAVQAPVDGILHRTGIHHRDSLTVTATKAIPRFVAQVLKHKSSDTIGTAKWLPLL